MPRSENHSSVIQRSAAIEIWLEKAEKSVPGFTNAHNRFEDSLREFNPEFLSRFYKMIEELISYEYNTWEFPPGFVNWIDERVSYPTEVGNRVGNEVYHWAAEMGTMCGVYLWGIRKLDSIFRDVLEQVKKRAGRLRQHEAAAIADLQALYTDVLIYQSQPAVLLRTMPMWMSMPLKDIAEQGADLSGYDKNAMIGSVLRAHANRISDEKRRLNPTELKEMYQILLSMMKVERKVTGQVLPNYRFSLSLLSMASGSYAYSLFDKDRSWMTRVANTNQREHLLAGAGFMKLVRLFHTDWWLSLLNQDARFHKEALAIFDFVYETNKEVAGMLFEESTTAMVLFPEKFGFKKTSDAIITIAQWYLAAHATSSQNETTSSEPAASQPEKQNSLQEPVILLLANYHQSVYNERLLIGATNLQAITYLEEGSALPAHETALPQVAAACQQIHQAYNDLQASQSAYQRRVQLNLRENSPNAYMLNFLIPNQADIELTYQVRQKYVMAKVWLSDYEIDVNSIPTGEQELTLDELRQQKLVVQFAVDLSSEQPELIFEVYDPEDVSRDSKDIWSSLLLTQLQDWAAELVAELAERPAPNRVEPLDKGSVARKTGQIPTQAESSTQKRKSKPNGSNGANGADVNSLPVFIETGRRFMYPYTLQLAPALEAELAKSRGKGARADELFILPEFINEFNSNPSRFHSEKVTKAVRSSKAAGPNGELVWRIKRGDYRIFVVSFDRSQGVIVDVDRKSDVTYEDMSGLKEKVRQAVSQLQDRS